MTNFEKNINKIIDVLIDTEYCAATNNFLCSCRAISCDRCQFNVKYDTCRSQFKKWLLDECPTEIVDWTKVPTDTPILVKNKANDVFLKRYFAYIDTDGKICSFPYGVTSWTVEELTNKAHKWNFVELAREEDKEKYKKDKIK